jgi:hypothetical protein
MLIIWWEGKREVGWGEAVHPKNVKVINYN